MDTSAMQAAAAASKAAYRSFAEATGAVLDLLGSHLPDCTVYLSHLDRSHQTHRIVDARRGDGFGLRSNVTMPLAESFDAAMAAERAPRLCNDVPAHKVYSQLPAQRRWGVASLVAAPVELTDGSRVGALAAVSRQPGRFRAADEELFAMLGRMLAFELERETSQRDGRRLNETMRAQARALESLGAVAGALATDGDPRPAVCKAACDVSGASAAFLLEPSGREFVSSAMHGVEMGPVTIQPRGETTGRAFQATESYFVADATDHPALAAPLVESTGARSALFEPVLRDGAVAGVLILIWRDRLDALPEATANAVRLLAAQGAVAIQQAGLRDRVDRLALTDPLTGVPSKRLFDEELPRELARSRRNDVPVSIALLDVDHMTAFNMMRGDGEGDHLLKEAAALWDRQLREVDLLARLEGAQFGVILPNCGVSEAIEVLDRVRSVTPRGQTASAGVARWDTEEPAELLVLRCADALAAAKAEGGNSTVGAD